MQCLHDASSPALLGVVTGVSCRVRGPSLVTLTGGRALPSVVVGRRTPIACAPRWVRRLDTGTTVGARRREQGGAGNGRWS